MIDIENLVKEQNSSALANLTGNDGPANEHTTRSQPMIVKSTLSACQNLPSTQAPDKTKNIPALKPKSVAKSIFRPLSPLKTPVEKFCGPMVPSYVFVIITIVIVVLVQFTFITFIFALGMSAEKVYQRE